MTVFEQVVIVAAIVTAVLFAYISLKSVATVILVILSVREKTPTEVSAKPITDLIDQIFQSNMNLILSGKGKWVLGQRSYLRLKLEQFKLEHERWSHHSPEFRFLKSLDSPTLGIQPKDPIIAYGLPIEVSEFDSQQDIVEYKEFV